MTAVNVKAALGECWKNVLHRGFGLINMDLEQKDERTGSEQLKWELVMGSWGFSMDDT